MAAKPFTIGDLRGGRNDSDPVLSLADDQCLEALNVDWWKGTLANKRSGAVDRGATSPPGEIIGTVARHVPGTDETAAELWAWGDSFGTYRLAGGSAWAAPTVVDALQANEESVVGVSFAGMFFIAENTAQNRLHVWDPSLAKVRRVGLATPAAAPTGADDGGGGLSLTRSYRVRWVDVSGTVVRRMSEASAILTRTIAAKAGSTITRPTAASEDETHWDLEAATLPAGPWYRIARTAIGTTTFDDTSATISTTNLSASAGINFPPPSAKFLVKADARLVMAGCWETSGGYTTPNDRRVWWTPPFGASDIGDAERIPNTTGIGAGYGTDVEADVTGLSDPIDGTVYVFAYKRIWALEPTGSSGAAAYRRRTVRTDIGCIRHQSIKLGEDEHGNPAIYFLSHRGPYRIAADGIQYLGNDMETVWGTVNLDATKVLCWSEYYTEKHQWWVGLSVSGGNSPTIRMMLDTRLIRYNEDQKLLGGGWAKHTGPSCDARSCCLFSVTIGASMSRALVPHIAQYDALGRVWKCDTGTDDAGSTFQAYVETKPFAPFGLGMNMSVTDPQLIAEVASGVTITVTPISDFGLAAVQAGTVLLTAVGSETRVQKRVEGFQAAGIGVIGYRIGDAAAVANAWTIDALVGMANPQESRS